MLEQHKDQCIKAGNHMDARKPFLSFLRITSAITISLRPIMLAIASAASRIVSKSDYQKRPPRAIGGFFQLAPTAVSESVHQCVREQIGVIAAYRAAGAITRLAARRARYVQRHNRGRVMMTPIDSAGHDPAARG
jgi:hypothetical protein